MLVYRHGVADFDNFKVPEAELKADNKACIDGKCIHVKAVIRNFVVRKADRERFGDQVPR